ncbi:MAG TPA: hypothetical protein QF753_09345 [Victivallales bacterium]|nr:hypothetical protein [Victivallales bacterium]
MEICIKYLEALNSGNLEEVLSLFEENAVVISPLYGKLSAIKFYTDLFAETGNSNTTLLNVFEKSCSKNNCIALHFNYEWTLKNNVIVNFECVDIVSINSKGDKFTKLTIIYDTYPIRKDYESNKKVS